MQVRIDCDDPVEGFVQHGGKDMLADRFAGVELLVLSHIGQVRRDEDQSLRAGAPQPIGGKQEFDELLIWTIERPVEDRGRRCRSDSRQDFAVGKGVRLDKSQRAAKGPGKAARRRCFVWKGMNQRGHPRSSPML